MPGLYVPGHVAKARKVPSADNTAPESDVLSRDATMSEEQIKLCIERWDVDPVGQRIFVAPIPREKSSGGIYLAQVDADLSWDGVVIAVGPLAFVHRNPPEAPKANEGEDEYGAYQRTAAYRLKPGDRVSFARWSGEVMKRWWIEAPPLKVMNADDVIGMIKENAK